MDAWFLRFSAVAAGTLLMVACSTPSPSSPPTPTPAPAVPTTAPAAVARPAAAVPAASPMASPAPAARPVAAAPTPVALAESAGRMVIYTTEITLLAADLSRLPSELANLVSSQGGYVAGVETKNDGGIPTNVVRLKVPPERYEATMSAIRGAAVEVLSEKATTQDVTEEFSDTETQIASLEATHAQLLELMKRAGSVDELLRVQQEAGQVRLQIDRLKGHATVLERQSALASITVTAQSAGIMLEREYVAALASVRKSERDRAGLLAQLRRTRTPEEEGSLRDKLGEVELSLDRTRTELSRIASLAAGLALELPQPNESAPATVTDEDLAAQYLQTRLDLRRAELDQQRLTSDLQAGVASVDAPSVQAAILRTSELSVRLKTLQDRAAQVGVVLPSLSREEETALVPVSGASLLSETAAGIKRAWVASLELLVSIAGGLVFLWWLAPILGLAVILLRRPRVRRSS